MNISNRFKNEHLHEKLGQNVFFILLEYEIMSRGICFWKNRGISLYTSYWFHLNTTLLVLFEYLRKELRLEMVISLPINRTVGQIHITIWWRYTNTRHTKWLIWKILSKKPRHISAHSSDSCRSLGCRRKGNIFGGRQSRPAILDSSLERIGRATGDRLRNARFGGTKAGQNVRLGTLK